MYNRYIPADASYTQVREPTPPEEKRPRAEGKPAPERRPSPPQRNSRGKGGTAPGFRPTAFPGGMDGLSSLFSGKDRGGLSSLLKSLHMENIDPGDILLLLIVLYLLVEGDDLELVIALGLVLIMGLGEEKKETPDCENNRGRP